MAGSWADDSGDGLGSLAAPTWSSGRRDEGERVVDSQAFPELTAKPTGPRRGGASPPRGSDYPRRRSRSPPTRSRSRSPPMRDRDRDRDRSPPRRPRSPSPPGTWRSGGRRRSPSPPRRGGYRGGPGGRSRSPSPPGGGRDRRYERSPPPRSPRSRSRSPPPRRPREPVPFPDAPPYSAFVGNVPYEVSNRGLGEFFEDNHCSVLDARIVMERNSNPPVSRGYGYVDFRDAESLKNALALVNTELLGRTIHVDVAERRQQSSYGGRSGGYGGRMGDRDRGGWGDRGDRERREPPPDDRARTKIVLAPRGTVDADKLQELQRRPRTNKPDPFAGAKPRDERLFEERRRERKDREARERAAKEGQSSPQDSAEQRSPRSRPAASPRSSQELPRSEKPKGASGDDIVSRNPFDALESKR